MVFKDDKAVQMGAKKSAKIIAKKDFLIVQNGLEIKIEKGQELNEKVVPKQFWPNLKTEKVI